MITIENLHQAYPHLLVPKHTIQNLPESISHCSLSSCHTQKQTRSNRCSIASNDPIVQNQSSIILKDYHVLSNASRFDSAAMRSILHLQGAFIM